MNKVPQDSPDWYEDDQAPDSIQDHPHRVPGLPGSWSNYVWWICCIGFAGIWVSESVSAVDPSRGFGNYNSFVGNVWNLFLVLFICYLIFRIARPLTSGFAYLLSGAVAFYLLLTHTF